MNLVFIVYSLKDFLVDRIATIPCATCVEFKIAFLPNIHLRIIDVPYYGLEARFCMITKEIGNVTTTKLDYIV